MSGTVSSCATVTGVDEVPWSIRDCGGHLVGVYWARLATVRLELRDPFTAERVPEDERPLYDAWREDRGCGFVWTDSDIRRWSP